jgi:sugar lactone lactonase YvrE
VGGTATTVTATIIDNAASSTCTPITIAFKPMEGGAVTTEFGVGNVSACKAALGTGNGTFSAGVTLGGEVATLTLTFNPSTAGERSAALNITDSTNSAFGTATVTGIGQGAIANLDPGVSTAFTTGFTSPTSVVADVAGDLFVADAGAGKVYEIAAGTTTLTSIGSFTTPVDLVLDANGNLYVADSGTNQIDEIANTFSGALGGFTAGAQSVAVSSSAMIGGLALNAPNGLAIGPDGVLYISDSKNARVVTFNPVNGITSPTIATSANGLISPTGVAVDSANNLYVADKTAGLYIYIAGGGITSVAPKGATEPVGVAVEPSGTPIVADLLTGAIVRIPLNGSGIPIGANAYVIEQNPSSAQSLFMDAAGDIYTADVSGKAVYAIQRTAASLNFGTVSDGLNLSLPVTLMNAGNAPATLASPAYTAPNNPLFSFGPAGSNGCGSGNGPAGASCQFSATFSPITGSTQESGTASILLSSPAGSATVNLTGLSTTSSILPQTITNFNPKTPILAGQQFTLTATPGASGNPVTFKIDGTSACVPCATISGDVLTAVATGTIIVDANELGGTVGGKQYSNAPTVKVTITINSAVAADVKAILVSQNQWFPKLVSGGFTAGANPAGGSFAINQQGNVYVGSQYGGDVEMYNPSKGTVVSFATISNPGGIAVDSHNNLYISHDYNSIILKVPYVNGAYAAVTDATSAPATSGASRFPMDPPLRREPARSSSATLPASLRVLALWSIRMSTRSARLRLIPGATSSLPRASTPRRATSATWPRRAPISTSCFSAPAILPPRRSCCRPTHPLLRWGTITTSWMAWL